MINLVESNHLPTHPALSASSTGVTERVEEASSTFTGATAPCALGNLNAEASLTDSEEYRVKEANRRQEVLNTFEELLRNGNSKRAASKAVGESVTTIWRWRHKFKKEGYNGLLPATDKCGRPSIIDKLGVPQDVIDAIKGLNLDLESTTGASRLFAQSDKCPEQLARVILDPNRCSKHALPPSLRRAVTPTDSERLAHRGPRALALKGIWTPRMLDILPGDIFCSDDTTPIWAWWVPWVTNEEYPFGEKLLQGQLLPIIDIGSQKPLTFALIAREKSSYRASDIWGLFGHTFQKVGLPRLGFQLERGSWEANLIAGQEVEYEQGEMSQSRRVGGLRQLPSNVTPWHVQKLGGEIFPKTLQTWTSFLPKSKSIEAFFDRSQSLEATLWGSLGRDQMRKPNEKMKKLYQTCSRPGAKERPSDNFLSHTEIMARIVEMWRYISNEPMEGEVFSGVPDLKWDQAIAEYPLIQLPEEDAWLYKRNWATATVDRGMVRVRLTHDISGERYSLFYSNPTVFAQHGVDGQEVAVYYDRNEFEQPAQIILARTGDFLCEAKYIERVGSFLQGDKSGHDVRKQWKNAVMTGYGTIAKHAPSRQLPEEIKARRDIAKANQPPGPVGKAPAPLIVSRVPQAAQPAVVTVDRENQINRFSRQAELARLRRGILKDQ